MFMYVKEVLAVWTANGPYKSIWENERFTEQLGQESENITSAWECDDMKEKCRSLAIYHLMVKRRRMKEGKWNLDNCPENV